MAGLGARLAKDAVPSDRVLGKEPAFQLPPISVVEDADHPRLDIDAVPASAHVAQRTDVLVVAKHVVLCHPEPVIAQPGQERHDCRAPADVTGPRVATGNVPDY